MHCNQLGIFHVLNAEGIIMLAENKAGRWGCDFNQALYHLFNDFKGFCSRERITCSHRRWRRSHLHMETVVSGVHVPTHPWLNGKAMNSRIILAWIAAPWLMFHYQKKCWILSVCFGRIYIG